MVWNRIYRGAATAVVLASALASQSFAGPLDKSLVSADASWIGHVDIEAFSKSKLAAVLLDFGLRAQVEEVQAKVGFDLLKDGLSVTIYSVKGSPEDGAILISATSKVDAALAGLAEEAEGYEQITVGDRALDSWTFDDGRMYSYTRKDGDKRLIVAAENLENLMAALAVIDGDSANLATSEKADGLKVNAGGSSWFYVGVNEMANLPTLPMVGPMMESIQGFAIDLGENSEEAVEVVVSLMTDTAESATQMQGMINGALSVVKAQLNLQRESLDLGTVLAVLEKLKVKTDGASLSVKLSVAADKIIEMISEIENANSLEDGM